MAKVHPCPMAKRHGKHRWRTTYFPFDPPFRQCKRCGLRQRLRLAPPPDDYWYWLSLPDPNLPRGHQEAHLPA